MPAAVVVAVFVRVARWVGSCSSTSTVQPSGRKSQAVLSEGAGMPGVSGELKLSGPPMSGVLANEPGVVA